MTVTALLIIAALLAGAAAALALIAAHRPADAGITHEGADQAYADELARMESGLRRPRTEHQA